jgi:hypothetical protein
VHDSELEVDMMTPEERALNHVIQDWELDPDDPETKPMVESTTRYALACTHYALVDLWEAIIAETPKLLRPPIRLYRAYLVWWGRRNR